jgi:hypothetical protein
VAITQDTHPEPCVCTHAQDTHEDTGVLWVVWCTAPGCLCKNYWPESRRSEFERRRGFLLNLKEAHPDDFALQAIPSRGSLPYTTV